MTFVNIYPLIKLGIRWVGATGKCIQAKKAAGEEINFWDYLTCAVTSLDVVEQDLIGQLTAFDSNAAKTRNV